MFVEAGCGTAESSSRIDPAGRTLVAMDISRLAVRAARRIPVFRGLAQGDLFRLPFRSASVAGLWNLGVMEHFEPEEGRALLREFARVLRPGGVALLFWPPEFGASRLVLAPVEALRSRPGAPFRFFPGRGQPPAAPARTPPRCSRARASSPRRFRSGPGTSSFTSSSSRASRDEALRRHRRIQRARERRPADRAPRRGRSTGSASDWEILYVVEGTDGTREALDGVARDDPRVKVLYRAEPSGLGAAFRRGFAAVRPGTDFVLTMDADLNHQPEEIPALLAALETAGADIVVGSRFVPGSSVTGIPLWKRALSTSMNAAMRFLWGLKTRDKTSGFRAYRAGALRSLAFRNDNFAFLPEMLIDASQRGYSILEVPIRFTVRVHGVSKMHILTTSRSYLSLLRSRWDGWSLFALFAARRRRRLRVAYALSPLLVGRGLAPVGNAGVPSAARRVLFRACGSALSRLPARRARVGARARRSVRRSPRASSRSSRSSSSRGGSRGARPPASRSSSSPSRRLLPLCGRTCRTGTPRPSFSASPRCGPPPSRREHPGSLGAPGALRPRGGARVLELPPGARLRRAGALLVARSRRDRRAALRASSSPRRLRAGSGSVDRLQRAVPPSAVPPDPAARPGPGLRGSRFEPEALRFRALPGPASSRATSGRPRAARRGRSPAGRSLSSR